MWFWPNLFSLAKSISLAKSDFDFTGRIYFVKCMICVPVPQSPIFYEKPQAQKRRCLSIRDWCRFNELARNPLISSNKVVISINSSNKALIIVLSPKTHIKLGLIVDYSAKSRYVACENAIHEWSRCVIKNVQKRIHSLYIYFAAKFRRLLRTRVANFTSILPVSAKVAIFRNIVAVSMY